MAPGRRCWKPPSTTPNQRTQFRPDDRLVSGHQAPNSPTCTLRSAGLPLVYSAAVSLSMVSAPPKPPRARRLCWRGTLGVADPRRHQVHLRREPVAVDLLRVQALRSAWVRRRSIGGVCWRSAIFTEGRQIYGKPSPPWWLSMPARRPVRAADGLRPRHTTNRCGGCYVKQVGAAALVIPEGWAARAVKLADAAIVVGKQAGR